MNNRIWIIGAVILILVSTLAYSVTYEKDSPANHVTEDQIHVMNNQVIIDLPGAQWAKFTDTNSMDPVFDAEANTLEIRPKNTREISVGDIVSYKSNLYEGIIVHRVVATNYDSEGWYMTLKGDNNAFNDPEKVRFSQVNGIVVAVIY
jgi:signal peptidase I